jgi:hypothetical protein
MRRPLSSSLSLPHVAVSNRSCISQLCNIALMTCFLCCAHHFDHVRTLHTWAILGRMLQRTKFVRLPSRSPACSEAGCASVLPPGSCSLPQHVHRRASFSYHSGETRPFCAHNHVSLPRIVRQSALSSALEMCTLTTNKACLCLIVIHV